MDVLRYLVSCGADLNWDYRQSSHLPLYIAADRCHILATKYLLQLTHLHFSANDATDKNLIVLNDALRNKNYTAVETLLKAGINVRGHWTFCQDIVRNLTSMVPLHANTQLQIRCERGHMPLLLEYVVYMLGLCHLAECLIYAGARPCKIPVPLHLATSEEKKSGLNKTTLHKFVRLLLIAGFEPYIGRDGPKLLKRPEYLEYAALLNNYSPTLQSQCRVVIRDILAKQPKVATMTDKIAELPLPINVKAYLNLEH